MSTGKRPGGLTALAVINFVWGGIGLIGSSFMFFLENLGANKQGGEQEAQIAALEELGRGMFYFLVIVSMVSCLLLIFSGVGYLKLKKFLGRTLGNVYALLSIAYAVMGAAWMPEELGGGAVNISTILGLIYPGLTLFFLNVTFKEDFVN